MTLNQDDRTFIEETTGIYRFTLNGVLINGSLTPVPASLLDSFTLTLYDKYSGEIINNRDGQDILNANNVIVAATSGVVTWSIQSKDNPIVGLVDHLGIEYCDTDVDWLEEHVALFIAEWGGGENRAIHEVKLLVKNIGKVEQSSSQSSSSSSVSSTSSSSASSTSSSSSSSTSSSS
jgi:hypothetical protein